MTIVTPAANGCSMIKIIDLDPASQLLCILDCTGRLSLLAGMYIFWKIVTYVSSVSAELVPVRFSQVIVQIADEVSCSGFRQSPTRDPAFTVAIQILLHESIKIKGVATKFIV